jgi:hypothetical protein
MRDFHCCYVERRDFGDLLVGEAVERLHITTVSGAQALVNQRVPNAQSILAIWIQDPRTTNQFPILLVCLDDAVEDWAAWITTYVAKIRPFSAFMRLVGHSELQDMIERARPPELNHLLWPATGLVIGEVLAGSKLPDRSIESLSLNAFESTLSFAIFRACAIYKEFGKWPDLVKFWETTRRLTRQQQRSIDGDSVARVCLCAIEALKVGSAGTFLRPPDLDVVRTCRTLITSGTFSPFPPLDVPHFESIEKRMRGTREERVVAFSEFARHIVGSVSLHRELASFALGYFASRIAPGTIQHSSVLDPVMDRFPDAMLWYGFCAGLGKSDSGVRIPDVSTRQALDMPSIAKWIARDLLRQDSLTDFPNCDIAFNELVTLSRTGEEPLQGLTRSATGTAIIELFPAVWTVVNVLAKGDVAGPNRTAKEDERKRELISSISKQLDRLNVEFHELLTELDDQSQRSLFPSRRRRL